MGNACRISPQSLVVVRSRWCETRQRLRVLLIWISPKVEHTVLHIGGQIQDVDRDLLLELNRELLIRRRSPLPTCASVSAGVMAARTVESVQSSCPSSTKSASSAGCSTLTHP